MRLLAAALIAAMAGGAMAHEHHDEIEEGHTISDEPIDGTLWVHILVQMLAFGVLYPTGMVLGVGGHRPLHSSSPSNHRIRC